MSKPTASKLAATAALVAAVAAALQAAHEAGLSESEAKDALQPLLDRLDEGE